MSASLEKLLRDARIDLILARIEKDPSVIKEVIEQLDSNIRSIRFNSILVLGQIGEQSSPAIPKLSACLEDNDWSIRREAIRSLGNIGNVAEMAVSGLCKLSNNNETSIRKEVAIAFGKIGCATEGSIISLIKALEDIDEEVRIEAAISLGKLKVDSPEVISSLKKSLSDISWRVRAKTATTLGEIGNTSDEVISSLIDALQDIDWRVNICSINSLVKFGEIVIPSVLNALNHKKTQVRKAAIEILGELKLSNPKILNSLAPLLKNHKESIRGKTIDSLRNIGKPSVPLFEAAIKSSGKIPWFAFLPLVVVIITNIIVGITSFYMIFPFFLILIFIIFGVSFGLMLPLISIGIIIRSFLEVKKRRIFYISGIGAMEEDLTDSIPELIQKLETYGILKSKHNAIVSIKNPGFLKKIEYFFRKLGLAFIAFFTDPFNIKSNIRVEISRTLGKIGKGSNIAVDILTDALSDYRNRVRRASSLALGDIGSSASKAVPKLIEALNDLNPEIRWRASEALGKIGVDTQEVISGLEELLYDKFDHVSVSAEFALDKIKENT